MTTIVGFQGDGYTVLCSDSRISMVSEDTAVMKLTMASNHSKLCSLGRYAIGMAGDMRGLNIVQYVFSPPQPPANLKGKKLDAFITGKFIPALRECFDSQGFSTSKDDDNRSHQAQYSAEIVVSINSTIYKIDSDYGWSSDSRGIYVAGTGSQYVLGALEALLPARQPTLTQAKKIILRAMNIATRYDPNSGPPFNTIVQEVEKTR